MKIDRLIGILSILMQKEKVTAPFLAERFEVSRRTINRDIEDLCKAGIPLVTTQGAGGGISVVDGYCIDRTVLTSVEMQAILAGLKSLDSVSDNGKYRRLMDKLSVKDQMVSGSDSTILINLSSYYKSTLSPKMEMIQQAIYDKQMIVFDYYSPKGESCREIEPYRLIFQWSSWYVWGFCQLRQDYRLFKLNRVLNLSVTDRQYEPRDLPEYHMDIETNRVFPMTLAAEVIFEASAKWRLIDEYGLDSFTIREDGRLLFRNKFVNEENLLGWVLGFGAQAELVKPKELRGELAVLMEKMQRKYQ